MFDAIAAFLEIFLVDGVPSPLTLHKQRQARLAVSAVALAAILLLLAAVRHAISVDLVHCGDFGESLPGGFPVQRCRCCERTAFHCMAQHRGSDGCFRLAVCERFVGLLNFCGHA